LWQKTRGSKKNTGYKLGPMLDQKKWIVLNGATEENEKRGLGGGQIREIRKAKGIAGIGSELSPKIRDQGNEDSKNLTLAREKGGGKAKADVGKEGGM